MGTKQAFNPLSGEFDFVYDERPWSVASATVTDGGTITLGASQQQLISVSGSGGAVTASSTPFGSTAPTDGTLISLVGTSATNTVTVPFSDAAKGVLLNGPCTLGRGNSLKLQYNSGLDRYIEMGRV